MGNKVTTEDNTEAWTNQIISGMTDEEIATLRADTQKKRKS